MPGPDEPAQNEREFGLACRGDFQGGGVFANFGLDVREPEVLVPFPISISLPNNEQVFDDKSCGEGWQKDALG
jgi:hypothetical protein